MKQTAVSYLIETYQHSINGLTLDDLEYALQIEREQHKQTWIEAREFECNLQDFTKPEYIGFTEYYNQTFKTESK